MSGWVLNMPYICNAKQLTGFCLIRIFTKKFLPDMLLKYVQIHAKKMYINMKKVVSLKKIHMKIIIVKKFFELSGLGFPCTIMP